MSATTGDLYFGPPTLPPTQRHYPAQEVPGRPAIGQIRAPAGEDDDTLKPDRSHRDNKRDSLDTQVTSLSNSSGAKVNGGYNGVHTGLGTPMPWMTIHAHRMHESTYGAPLPRVKEEREEEGSESGKRRKSRWGFTLLIACFLIVLALIVIGAGVAIWYINREDTAAKETADEATNKREYFLANYRASMSTSSEQFIQDLQNSDSAKFLEAARRNCFKVDSMYLPGTLSNLYGGCEVTGFRDEGGALHIDMNIKILYVVDIKLEDGIAGTDRESEALAAGLTDLRRSMTSSVRETFISGVNAAPELNNAEISEVPETFVVTADTDYCSPHQCSGGGCVKWTVNGINTSYYCNCPESRTGKNCQVLKEK